MKKFLVWNFLWICLSVSSTFAQSANFKVQGRSHPILEKSKPSFNKVPQIQGAQKIANELDYTLFPIDSIKFWVGNGSNRAALVIDWYDHKGSSMVWGFRWPKDSIATGETMLRAIAAADPRFSVLLMGETQFGSVVGGLGYDAKKTGEKCLLYAHSATDLRCPNKEGVLFTDAYDFDDYNYPKDTNYRWFSAWTTFGYWSYQLKAKGESSFSWASEGASSRILTDGDWDGWGAQIGFESFEGVPPRMPFVAARPTITQIKISDRSKKIQKDSSWQVSTQIVPLEAEMETLHWQSQDTNIFTVNTQGLVSAIHSGNAFLYVSCLEGKYIDSCKITVIQPIEALSLNIQTDTLFVGVNESLKVDILPLDADCQNLSWYSNHSDIVKVDSTGKITALALGKAQIFVSDENKKFIDSCHILVREVDYTQGVFFVNEDWFGHTNGSVNFLSKNGKFIYRAYTRENPNESLGATTQFGTIYGDNFYFVSKQAADGGDQIHGGGRLVVADAKTLKKKASFDTLGNGDGRSILGINEKKAYLGTSNGIYIFDIDSLRIKGKIKMPHIDSSLYKGQIGTLLHIGDFVFACKQGVGILVLDANADSLLCTIACEKIGTIVQSLDGSLWASAYSDGLWRINPYTFVVEEKREIPEHAWIPASWGAWASSLLCASHQSNSLYWAKMNGSSLTSFGKKIYKYDIENPNLDSAFYELTRVSTEGKAEVFYGSALNIDPLNDRLVITTTQDGFSSNYQNNWVHFVNASTGQLIEIKTLDPYYWFPAMSVFPDNEAPEISTDLLPSYELDLKKEICISLKNKVSDKDNFDPAIHKMAVVMEGEDLVDAFVKNDSLYIKALKAGQAQVLLVCNSNGKIVQQQIAITIKQTIGDSTHIASEKPLALSVYPNPSSSYIYVRSTLGDQITLFNLSGQKIYQITARGNRTEINLEAFPKGTYLLNLNGRTAKIIKQ